MTAARGMVGTMPSTTEVARLVLVVGPEEVLVERAIERITRDTRAADPDTEILELDGPTLEVGRFLELAGPTLFGAPRLVLITGLPPTGAEADVFVAYLQDPADDVVVVVSHDGGAKGKKVLDALRRTKPLEISCARLTKRDDRIDFLRSEAAAVGGQITPGAANALLEAIGSDLREAASATRQLVSDAGGRVDEAVVRRYHLGRAEAKGWTIADRAIEGREAAALEELRWALSTGTEPVLVIGALAAGLRNVARVGGRSGRPEASIAAELGMPPWKVRTIRKQLSGWTPTGIEHALRAVATADGDVKGVTAHPAYALERAIRTICASRGG
jgi:DNA polymerase-3 subunit delta